MDASLRKQVQEIEIYLKHSLKRIGVSRNRLLACSWEIVIKNNVAFCLLLSVLCYRSVKIDGSIARNRSVTRNRIVIEKIMFLMAASHEITERHTKSDSVTLLAGSWVIAVEKIMLLSVLCYRSMKLNGSVSRNPSVTRNHEIG